MQAGNIVTSTTNLIKTWSTLPFGVGLIAAFAQVAGIIAFIANIRAKSRQIASQARYGKTGFLTKDNIVEGRTHAQGGELLEVERGELVQVADDGGKRRIEVVRRERAREYMDLLRAANEGDRETVVVQALKLAQFGSLPKETQSRIFQYYVDQPKTAVSTAPVLAKSQVRKLVFGKQSNTALNVVVQGNDSKRTNELLERMLTVMADSDRGERWSADGKTRYRGNVKTRFIG